MSWKLLISASETRHACRGISDTETSQPMQEGPETPRPRGPRHVDGAGQRLGWSEQLLSAGAERKESISHRPSYPPPSVPTRFSFPLAFSSSRPLRVSWS